MGDDARRKEVKIHPHEENVWLKNGGALSAAISMRVNTLLMFVRSVTPHGKLS